MFVYVKDGLGNRTFDAPKDPVVLDQKGCQYHPHVLGVMAGQTVQIKNDDPTTHNIHPTPKDNREWNESQPPSSPAIEKNFAREEIMLPVKCNQHPWMKMYINVVKSPFFAVTDKDGKYEIKGLPPGDYTIAFVQEKLGRAGPEGDGRRERLEDRGSELQSRRRVAATVLKYRVGWSGLLSAGSLPRPPDRDGTVAASGTPDPRGTTLKAIATTYNRGHHRLAVVLACWTFLLIIAGALVTSNDAGLSVPDWPTSFGSWYKIPKLVGGVKFEHTHRMIAQGCGTADDYPGDLDVAH